MAALNPFARLVLRWLVAVALVGAIALVVNNQKTLAGAQKEQEGLLRDQTESQRLAVENAELNLLRATNEVVHDLRLANGDLPRLRNEIHRLRQAAGEAAKLREDNQRLSARNSGSAKPASASLPADYITRDEIAEAGLASPEAAVQTFFHAMMQGDINRATQCSTQADAHAPTPAELDEAKTQLAKEFADFPGFRIAEKTVLSANEVRIGIETSPGATIVPMKFKLIGTEWKLDQ